jgi:hypothetical protein
MGPLGASLALVNCDRLFQDLRLLWIAAALAFSATTSETATLISWRGLYTPTLFTVFLGTAGALHCCGPGLTRKAKGRQHS